MGNEAISLVNPAVLNDNRMTIRSIIRDSYKEAKRQLQDSASVFKDDLTSVYDKAGSCLNRMTLPINNFLKDLSQIDTEFKEQASRGSEQETTGTIMPTEQALLSPLEENY